MVLISSKSQMVLEATEFPTKQDSNQPPQLLAIKLKISCMASLGMFIIVNNKGADQSAQMHMYEHSENDDIWLIFS